MGKITKRDLTDQFIEELQYSARVTSIGSNAMSAINQSLSQLVTNLSLRLKINTMNSSSVTLALNNFGVKSIKRISPITGFKVELTGGELKTSSYVDLVYDGTDYVIVNSDISIYGTSIYTPSTLEPGETETIICNVAGARLGDHLDSISFSSNLDGAWLNGNIVSDNTVSVCLFNPTNISKTVSYGNITIKITKI